MLLETILSIVLALVFAGAGGAKLAGQPMMRESATHFGIPWERYRLIGVLEVAAVVGLLVGLAVEPLALAAAVGLVLLMAGAVVFHLRAGDPPGRWAPPAVLGLLALVLVVALL